MDQRGAAPGPAAGLPGGGPKDKATRAAHLQRTPYMAIGRMPGGGRTPR
jgi:hypothetical protein